jgi:two-component system phosphate regulon sensor histidine kinase PhoR
LPTVANEVRDQSLQFMKDETQRLVRLVNNTLELGRLESSGEQEVRPVDLLALAEDAVAQTVHQAQASQANLAIQADAPLPLALGQPERLKQVFLNLLENAIKYGAPGNQITVRLRGTTDGLHCAVCDTGPGIPADHLPNVTQRFYRAAPAGVPGSGLGLALVAEILRQHQSQLHITSQTADLSTELGTPAKRGTCVHFTLPAVVWEVHT